MLSQRVRRIADAVEAPVADKVPATTEELWKDFHDAWSTRKDLTNRYFRTMRDVDLNVYDQNSTKPKTQFALKRGDLFWVKREGQENTTDADKAIILVAKLVGAKTFEYDEKEELIVKIKEIYGALDDRDLQEITKQNWAQGGKPFALPKPAKPTETKPSEENLFKPESVGGQALAALRALEYKDKQARRLIKEILAKQPKTNLEELVRLVLKQEKPEK